MARTRLRKRGPNKRSKSGSKTVTDKQRVFVEAYMIDFNGTKAARIAGYKDAKQQARKFLNGIDFPYVTQEIGKLRQKQIDQLGIRREEVIHHVLTILRANPADLVDEDGVLVENLHDLPLGLQYRINGLEVQQHYDDKGNVVGQNIKLKLLNAERIIDMMNKILGNYVTDPTEESSNNSTVDFEQLMLDAVEKAQADDIETKILDVKPTAKRVSK